MEGTMDWVQTASIIIPMALMFGASFKFMWSRIDKKFEAIDKRFEAIDKRFEAILAELKEIKLSIQSLEVRVGRLETQDEERFRNEIKLLIREKREN